jgi:membrane protein YdbS with pleckstrin-like domain
MFSEGYGMATSSPDKSGPRGAALIPASDSPSPADARSHGEKPRRVAAREEVDVWWGSYAGRAMLPGFAVCLIITVLLLVLDWYLAIHHLRTDLISSAILSLAGALWLFEGTRWVYRMIAVNYRLTNRRLLYTRGFKVPENWTVDLARVREVSVLRSPLERLLGVGHIRIQVQDNSLPPLVLEAVLAPERVARTIRRRVRQAQAAS